MKISIDQKRLSLIDRFHIGVNGNERFIGKRKFFSYKLEVFSSEMEVMAVVKRKSHTELDASYSINILHDGDYEFTTVSRKRGIWKIVGQKSEYILYEHEGFNYSLYKNDIQIGKAIKNDFVVLGGDRFSVQANNGENILLLISIFLSLDNACFIDRGFRFGYSTKLSKDGKRRDWNWKPKQN